MTVVIETAHWLKPEWMAGYRPCDLCDWTACDDIWAGKSEEQFRALYRCHPAQIVVCEECLGEFLREEPGA